MPGLTALSIGTDCNLLSLHLRHSLGKMRKIRRRRINQYSKMNDFDSLFDDFKNKVLLIDARLIRLLPSDMSKQQFQYFVQNLVEKWDSDQLRITIECLLFIYSISLNEAQTDDFIQILEEHLPVFQDFFMVADHSL